MSKKQSHLQEIDNVDNLNTSSYTKDHKSIFSYSMAERLESNESTTSSRLSFSNPVEFPGLFDILMDKPSCTPKRKSSLYRRSSSGYDSVHQEENKPEEREEQLLHEEGREYLRLCGHNLNSVLNNPRINWGESLLEALTWSESHDLLPSLPPLPGLELSLKGYLNRYNNDIELFQRNHDLKNQGQQLLTELTPISSQTDEDVSKCFQLVPMHFFLSDFDLTQPEIFESIILGSDIQKQEQLSQYLDSVEICLLKQISSRSEQFFKASSHQEVVKGNVCQACKQVDDLRNKIRQLRDRIINQNLRIIHFHRKKKRLGEISHMLEVVNELQQMESFIQALIHTQDFVGALDLIFAAKIKHQHVLEQLKCLRSVHEKLIEYEELVADQLSDQWIRIILSPEWEFSFDEDENEKKKKSLGEFICPLINALFPISHRMTQCLHKYHQRLTQEIKVVVKTVVTETIDSMNLIQEGEDKESDSKVASQLRALNSDEFLACAEMIFEHMILMLQKIVVVHSILKQTLNKLDATTTEPHGNNENPHASSIISLSDDIIHKICEFSQRSVSNLFAVRKEVQSTYTLVQLRTLYDETMKFVVNLETITGKTDYTLRGALFSQLKLFFEKYHTIQVLRLVSTLDHELWKAAEVSSSRQEEIEYFVKHLEVPMMLSEERKTSLTSLKPSKVVSLDVHRFRVVWSVLLTLEICFNYLICINNFAVLSTDVMLKLIEIFRLFNSRTAYLVLGAGAMQVARLKSISARHLALASQSLDLVVFILPFVRTFLGSFVPKRQHLLLEDLGKLLNDFSDHREKIFSKFVHIVDDQIMKRCLATGKLELIDYNLASCAIPSEPIKQILDGISKLHNVLKPVLPEKSIQVIFSRINEKLDEKLLQFYENVRPESLEGKKRIVQDIKHLMMGMENLQGIQLNTDQLIYRFEQFYLE